MGIGLIRLLLLGRLKVRKRREGFWGGECGWKASTMFGEESALRRDSDIIRYETLTESI